MCMCICLCAAAYIYTVYICTYMYKDILSNGGVPRCNAGWRIKFARGKKSSFSVLSLRNLKSRKYQISGHLFYCVHSLGLWTGFINPPNIWTALLKKERYKQKPSRLKCSKMPRIWMDNPLKWFLSISRDYCFYFEKVLKNSNSERVRRFERLFIRANLILRQA